MTDEFLQTSDADIFAAGDVAQVFDPLTGSSVIDSLWNTGREQGTTAGFNLAGLKRAYRKPISLNVARLAGVLTTIIGAVGSGREADQAQLGRGSSESWRAAANASTLETAGEVNHLRLMIGERTLLGGVLMGDQAVSIALQNLVAGQVDITPIRERLVQPQADLGQVLFDFWIKVRSHAGQ